MKKWFSMLAFLLALSHDAFATAQIPETLIFGGQNKALFTNPLDIWIKSPGNADRIRPYISERKCSASWRGYAGTWEIRGDQLLLVKLQADPCSQKSREIPLSALFSGQTAPIVATWFSGRLTVPDGKRLKYVHMGYMSQYERYILLQVDRGIVIDRQVVTELPGAGPKPDPFPRKDDPPPPRLVP